LNIIKLQVKLKCSNKSADGEVEVGAEDSLGRRDLLMMMSFLKMMILNLNRFFYFLKYFDRFDRSLIILFDCSPSFVARIKQSLD